MIYDILQGNNTYRIHHHHHHGQYIYLQLEYVPQNMYSIATAHLAGQQEQQQTARHPVRFSRQKKETDLAETEKPFKPKISFFGKSVVGAGIGFTSAAARCPVLTMFRAHCQSQSQCRERRVKCRTMSQPVGEFREMVVAYWRIL